MAARAAPTLLPRLLRLQARARPPLQPPPRPAASPQPSPPAVAAAAGVVSAPAPALAAPPPLRPPGCCWRRRRRPPGRQHPAQRALQGTSRPRCCYRWGRALLPPLPGSTPGSPNTPRGRRPSHRAHYCPRWALPGYRAQRARHHSRRWRWRCLRPQPLLQGPAWPARRRWHCPAAIAPPLPPPPAPPPPLLAAGGAASWLSSGRPAWPPAPQLLRPPPPPPCVATSHGGRSRHTLFAHLGPKVQSVIQRFRPVQRALSAQQQTQIFCSYSLVIRGMAEGLQIGCPHLMSAIMAS